VQLTLLGDELLVTVTDALYTLGLGQSGAFGPVEPPRMSGYHPGSVEDLHLGFGLADLELVTDEASGDFETEGVDVDVALEVDDPSVDAVDGGAPGRQRPQAEAL
jgi:hypothetical protein